MSQELMDYFMRETNRQLKTLQDGQDEIRKDMTKLVAFRMTVIAIAGAVSAAVAAIAEVIVAHIR